MGGVKCCLLVILYNCELDSSPTIKSILAGATSLAEDDELVLWDNSNNDVNHQSVARLKGIIKCNIQYHHTPENLALSLIYNRVVAQTKARFIFIFDQDSFFNAAYFDEFKAVAKMYDVNLFLPLIQVNGKIVSPADARLFRGKYWEKARYGLVPAAGKLAVTSGMIIKVTYLKQSPFDERLALYGIDSNFMIQYGRKNEYFYVMKSHFIHNMSAFEKETVEQKLMRFRSDRCAILVNAGLLPAYMRWLAYIYVAYVSAINFWRYKDLRFLKR